MKTKAGQYAAFDAVQKVLAHIERQAKQGGDALPYDGLFALPAFPLDALADVFTLTRMDDAHSADVLPSLLVEADGGQAQVEACPFGPLALVTGDGDMDTDPLAALLRDAGITPLFAPDLDAAGAWHDAPLVRWLFPARLSDALSLFDALRLRAIGGEIGPE